MVQRVLSAKTVEDGRKGAIFAGLLKLPLLFLLVLPGTVGILLYPGLDNPNLIYTELMYGLIPAGMLGIILTGLVAALMSSIDSALTASSSIATMDLYRNFRPEASQKVLVNMGKIFIIIAVVLASVWAPIIELFPTLWEYLQAVLSYLCPPIVVCFLFGLFWKGATADGAFYSLIGGSSLAVLLIVNNYIFQMFAPVHFLYSATLIFLFSSMVIFFVSLVKPEKVVSEFFRSSKERLSEVSVVWYKNHRIHALVVLMLTVVLVISFW